VLFLDIDANGVDSLAVGSHEFEFRIFLPKMLVSTITSSWIEVNYTAEARLIDTTTKKVLATACKIITIFDYLNLNLDRTNMVSKYTLKLYIYSAL
jgi:hypothetical protein